VTQEKPEEIGNAKAIESVSLLLLQIQQQLEQPILSQSISWSSHQLELLYDPGFLHSF